MGLAGKKWETEMLNDVLNLQTYYKSLRLEKHPEIYMEDPVYYSDKFLNPNRCSFVTKVVGHGQIFICLGQQSE